MQLGRANKFKRAQGNYYLWLFKGSFYSGSHSSFFETPTSFLEERRRRVKGSCAAHGRACRTVGFITGFSVQAEAGRRWKSRSTSNQIPNRKP